MNFEYIASAITMLRYSEKVIEDPRSRYVFDKMMETIDPRIGLLFNAYTEQKQGNLLYKYKSPNVKTIMSDSGGLQITTLGLDSAKVKKAHKEIYKVQANHSDIAMIFDEMSIMSFSSGGKDSRINTHNNRKFIASEAKQRAIETAHNIKEQIRVFDEYESNTKIMMIAQGNCLSTYKQYTETIIEELSDYEITKIHGLAPSGASNGAGSAEIFDMLYYIKELDIPEAIKSNIHLLGVGSATRLIPLLKSHDYFSFIGNVTFDSSSHTRKYGIDGCLDHTTKGIDRTLIGDARLEPYRKTYMMHEELIKSVDGVPSDYTLEQFVNEVTYFSPDNKKDVWSFINPTKPYAQALYLILSVQSLLNNVNRVYSIIEEEQNNPCNMLTPIQSLEDWYKIRTFAVQKYGLVSKKIQSVESTESFEKIVERKKTMEGLL